MPLALFDLDNTLLTADSDYLWGEYLCAQDIVDRQEYSRRNEEFYQQYLQGQMDIDAFLKFALRPLQQLPLAQLLELRADFIDSTLEQLIAPGSAALIHQHQLAGDTLVIITATNRFVSAPIARNLGIAHLIATQPTMGDAGFDGSYQNPPCFREGKIANINQWLTSYNLSADGSYAYSDSHNDLALLEWADNPVAVDPDDSLRATAIQRNWPVISLR